MESHFLQPMNAQEWMLLIALLLCAFVLGIIIAWLIWRGKVSELEKTLKSTKLKKSQAENENRVLKDKLQLREADLQKTTLELNDLKQLKTATQEQLNDQKAIVSVAKDQVQELKKVNSSQEKEIDYLQKQVNDLEQRLQHAKKKSAPKEAAPTPMASTNVNSSPEELRRIEGIGPKIESILHGQGIKTFEALSKAKVADLRTILENAGNRYKMHDPSTWPKQAKLAAAGKWDQLDKLQDSLKGGRKVVD